ncbi:MAG: molybdenum cofactor guanylyltransferase [Marinomonas sp.]
MRTLAGVVIAGGRAQRMSGVEKGLVCYKGKPMILWVAMAMSKVSQTVLLNVNRQLSDYQLLGYDVFEDTERYADRGPLSGLWNALNKVSTTHLLVSPCDTPNISAEAFVRLNEASLDRPDKIHCLEGESGMHPLHAIMPVESALECLTAFFAEAKGNSMMAFYQRHGYECLHWGFANELLNVNYQEQVVAS